MSVYAYQSAHCITVIIVGSELGYSGSNIFHIILIALGKVWLTILPLAMGKNQQTKATHLGEQKLWIQTRFGDRYLCKAIPT